jgi:DNA-directed RNA polymerase subunit E"
VKACKVCHMLTDENVCPNCHSPTSKTWQGYVVILDPKHSKIARRMNIKNAGKYALKVR